MTSVSTAHDHAPAARPSQPVAVPSRPAAIHKAFTLLRKVEPYGQSALLLGLRLLYGLFFVQAGWGKLVHLERTSGFFESLGLPAPLFTAGLVGVTELLGGVLLAAGIKSRLTAATLSIVMLTAFITAHAEDALSSLTAFTEQAPYPFLLATLAVLAFGAGRLSVDHLVRLLLERKRSGRVSVDKSD